MNILAIETTGAEASVALIDENGRVFEEVSAQKLNHLQNLMPMVDDLLKKCGLSIGDVSYVAVSEGPGSFTGIRIGVASARALAQALEIETISVPTLTSFLYNAPDYRGIICPIFDARRSQVYSGAYRWPGEEEGLSGDAYLRLIPDDAYDLAGLLDKIAALSQGETGLIDGKKEITFFGDGVPVYREDILKWQDSSSNDNIRVFFAAEGINLQKASSIAKLGYELYQKGKIKPFYDLKPVYLRKAEAERKLEEKG